MTYDEAVRYLLALGRELAAPRQPAAAGSLRAQKFDLANIQALAAHLGHPQRTHPSVHIAGTNGKGSVAAMLESILRAAGLTTGLYTSPHLERINERIAVAGAPIADADFAAAFTRILAAIEELLAAGPARPGGRGLAAHPTFFECLTAMAFEHFARVPVDIAVYEVGMGGRLDATNVVTPEVAVITAIDFDHENYLGHSIEAIAGEKAGIIKPGAWVVSAAGRDEARAVVARRAAEMDARLVDVAEAYHSRMVPAAREGCYRIAVRPQSRNFGGARAIEFVLPLAGRYQAANAVTAVAAARLLAERGFPITDEAIARGLETVRWHGRLERVADSPAVYLDGTHNPAGARALAEFLQENFPGRRLVLVYGAMRDKAVDEITGLLFPLAWRVVLTEPRQPRAISAAVLELLAREHAPPGGVEILPSPADALERAMAQATPEDVVVATGSLYLAADLLRHWRVRRAVPAGSGT
jgi:dihydrofolate synthase / folylpolyglutamate synthase